MTSSELRRNPNVGDDIDSTTFPDEEDEPPEPDSPDNLSSKISAPTAQEVGMLELVGLCDDIRAPKYFYDRLIRTLRRINKDGFEIDKAITRDTLIAHLQQNTKNRPQPLITNVKGTNVVHFSFLAMVQDLLSSCLFDDIENLNCNESAEDRFSQFIPVQSDLWNDILSGEWYSHTYPMKVKDPSREFLMPLILYGDKTGTDVNQRYPLEPWDHSCSQRYYTEWATILMDWTRSIMKRNLEMEESSTKRHRLDVK